MAALTTLANVKSWLNLSSATDDAILTTMINSYSEYIQTWLDRELASASYSEIRDGNGQQVMLFADYPVTAVSSVKINGNAILLAADGQSPGYRFNATKLWLNGYCFDRGLGNVEFSYTAGYNVIPFELERACVELVSLRYKERERIGQNSKSLAGETTAFMVKALPDSVLVILNNYKKVIPV